MLLKNVTHSFVVHTQPQYDILLTIRQFGCPTIHRLILLSSPPVASVRPFVGLSARQFTLELCAKNSPVGKVVCTLINAHHNVQARTHADVIAFHL